jgi:hypothetical protein
MREASWEVVLPCDKVVSRIKVCVADFERTMLLNAVFCDKWGLARRSLQIN